MTCPICQKRKPGRFCPAKAEKICAVCCGTEREITIDCPSDCAYLIAAHRYENDHPRALPADTPLLDVRISSDTIQVRGRFLSAVAFTIAKFCAGQPSATDPDVLAALRSLADTYKTLIAGIVYEQPPVPFVQRELYDALSAFLAEAKQNTSQGPAFGPIKDVEIFQLLVFLFRMGLLRTNGRPRSRRFIEFLRGQFPGAHELEREQSRIIVP
ncbi:MAG TPA: hypothetical protein VMH20_09965 [Verrucomicrobiae bacterium]|nr:hypothetical protein [Verrucomicrobiae bacterium]